MTSSGSRVLRFVSGNQGKLAEVRARLAGTSWQVESHPLDLVEIQGTPLQIATAKAKEAFEALRGTASAVLIEDSSLEFAQWNGLPGPYIKSFMEARGSQGLIDMLAAAPGHRVAIARCLFAYCDSITAPVRVFEASRTGTIVTSAPRGTHGFGWDDVFIPDQSDGRTYAEMLPEEKVAISARSEALSLMCASL